MRLKFLTATALFFACLAAHADTFSFTAHGGGIDTSFTIQLAPTGDPTIDEITGISGTFSSSGPYPYAGTSDSSGGVWSSGPFSGSITGLVPASYSSTNFTLNSLSAFDNLFYPFNANVTCHGGSTNQIFDPCGLDFIVANAYQVNLWGNGGDVFQISDGDLAGIAYFDYNVPVTLITVSPEPSSLVLLGTGVLGAFGAARKRYRVWVPESR